MRKSENIKKALNDICKNKELLFIENDPSGLYNAVGNFEEFCLENKIKYHTVLDASKVEFKSLLEQIELHDTIVWESTYSTELSQNLLELISSKRFHSKKLIECYIHKPAFYYKPDTHHRVFLLNSYGDGEDWEFYELKEDEKPIWDKEENEL